MRQYETFELEFSGGTLKDQWAQADLTASFSCGGEIKTVRGFYDGQGRYAVRFLPETAGEYTWRVTGAAHAEGRETCLPAQNGHGIVRAVQTHFTYEDGTVFYPFGTTVYALASQEDALVEKTLAALRSAPFNKVRMCVFPKHYDYNHNEPPHYPFERNLDGSWNVNRPNTAFWRRFERIVDRIAEMGIQIDLILFHPYDRWGFAALSQRDNLIYLDYLLRRLAAKPNLWWSLANEYDLGMDHKTLADWEEIENFVALNDPYRHLLSCHNCMCLWDFSRENVTHASIQTKALTEIPRWLQEYKKPVVIDECCYEGSLPHYWGSISGREMTRRFWRCAASGGYCTHGETFLSDDEVLWWSRGGRLKGESPDRIAFLRKIMESLPGPLTPGDGGYLAVAQLPENEFKEAIAQMPEGARTFFTLFSASLRRMNDRDKWLHLASEHVWDAHCGEEAYLLYCDLQCYGVQTLRLPPDKRYRVELIDTWNMTRETVLNDASGDTAVPMPGREDMALLAIRTA